MRATSIVVLVLFMTSVGYSQGSLTTAEQVVWDADSAWESAAGSNNVERMLSFYDDAAILITTTGEVAAGREQLRALWTRFFTTPGYLLKWRATRVEVAASGDLAYTYGAWQQSMLRDGEPRNTSGIYLAVWKKRQDGTWKVLVDKP